MITLKRRSLATLTLVTTLGMSVGMSEVLTTSAYAGGPPAKTFVVSGTVMGVNLPAHQFTVLEGAMRYTIMTTTRSTFTLNAAPATSASLRSGQWVMVRGTLRARLRVAPAVARRSPVALAISTVEATGALTTALSTALSQERYAMATYKNVITKLGPIRPFTNVAVAESHHVATLTALMVAHGITVPPSTTTGATAPTTRTASCELGVTIETGIVAMYQNGITLAKAFPDVVRAFNNLLDASQSDHLAAFLLCS